jgi:hypothetical protein
MHNLNYRLSMYPHHQVITPIYPRKTNRASWTKGTRIINQTKGHLSDEAKKKIKRSLQWLITSAREKRVYSKKRDTHFKFKISFCTLTLPTQADYKDTEIKRILNSWIVYAKYKFGLKNYVWKAEAQRNGNIHIHITSDCFMHYEQVKWSWNRLLKKNNLLNGHENPNSTDIHSVYKIKNLYSYLIKYYCKDEKDKRAIEGRLWGCSHCLSNIKNNWLEVDTHELKAITNEYFEKGMNWIGTKFADIFLLPKKFYEMLPVCEMKEAYNATLAYIRHSSHAYNPELFYTV